MRCLDMQNPGEGFAGASRNQLGGWLLHPITASERQAQMLASRFCLSPSIARHVAWLCYGEAASD